MEDKPNFGTAYPKGKLEWKIFPESCFCYVQFQKISKPTPRKVKGNFKWQGGFKSTIFLKESMTLNWNSREVGGSNLKPSVGGMNILWNNTIWKILSSCIIKIIATVTFFYIYSNLFLVLLDVGQSSESFCMSQFDGNIIIQILHHDNLRHNHRLHTVMETKNSSSTI